MGQGEGAGWRLGEILVQKGWITWEQLEEALQIQRDSQQSFQTILEQKREASDRSRPVLNLGEILIRQHMITWDLLQKALSIQKKSGGLIGEILVAHGMLSRANLMRAVAIQCNKAFVEIKGIQIPEDVIRLVPKRIVDEYHFIPIFRKDLALLIAVSDPKDVRAEEAVQKHLPEFQIHTAVANEDEIRNAINHYYPM
jgi:type IV pilus assembly protein PilB